MGLVGMLLGAARPGEAAALVKLRVAAEQVRKQVPAEEHWAFAYSMLQRVSRSFALVIQQLGPEIRNAVCVFYLVLRALDTVEDDTSIPTDVKVPVLQEFCRHVYNPDWHFACKVISLWFMIIVNVYHCFLNVLVVGVACELTGGTKDYKVLMDKFHYVSTAFLELGPGYQMAIEEITRRMGAGMAKFICKEVATVDDYDEYCHYVAGLVGYGLSRLFHASGLEDLAPDSLSNSMGLFLQKVNITRDYLEDINEIPKSRMFWPREIWSKYADKLEDFKYEENSTKAVQCLNEMVTNGLIHAEDCLQYMSALKDHATFRFCAIPQVMAIATYALCYNNVNVFQGVVKMRRGLTARIIDETHSMSDVYTAFYEFSSLLESKIDDNDPDAVLTRKRVSAIKETCKSSSLLNRRGYDLDMPKRNSAMIMMVIFILIAIVWGVYVGSDLSSVHTGHQYVQQPTA